MAKPSWSTARTSREVRSRKMRVIALDLRQALAALEAAEFEHHPPGTRRHAFAEAVRACAFPAVRLICALRGHGGTSQFVTQRRAFLAATAIVICYAAPYRRSFALIALRYAVLGGRVSERRDYAIGHVGWCAAGRSA